MAKYRVKENRWHGVGKKHGPGSIVELTEAEAEGFLDKLEPVIDEDEVELTEAEAEGFDADAILQQSIADIKATEYTNDQLASLLEAEKQGKARVSLIEYIEGLLSD